MIRYLLLAAVAHVSMAPSSAYASEELALLLPDGGAYYSTHFGTDAYNFTAVQGTAVSALCYFDPTHTGMTQVHPLALYDRETQEQLAYTVADSDSPLVGDFRCEPIEPVELQAGRKYQVGGYTRADSARHWVYAVDGLTWSDKIVYEGYVYIWNTTGDVVYVAQPPDNYYFAQYYFGPNFLIANYANPVDLCAAPELDICIDGGGSLFWVGVSDADSNPCRLRCSVGPGVPLACDPDSITCP